MHERLERAIIVTAADSGYFDLLKGMIGSIRQFEAYCHLPIAVFDVGFEPKHRTWLQEHAVTVVDPSWHFGLSEATAKRYERAALVRFFIHDYLPGYNYSLWLDPDLWLQDPGVLDRLVAGAQATGAAIAHESDRLYRFQGWLWAWNLKHKIVGSGLRDGLVLVVRPSYNLGLYCLAADAPHWALWRKRFESALRRTSRVTPYEQFAFNEIIHLDKLPTTVLESSDNWICDRCPPLYDVRTGLFCRPAPPYPPLSVLHLAGPAKSRRYEIGLVSGGARNMCLRFPHPIDEGKIQFVEAGEAVAAESKSSNTVRPGAQMAG